MARAIYSLLNTSRSSEIAVTCQGLGKRERRKCAKIALSISYCIEACSQPALDTARPSSLALSHKSKAMLSFTNPSNDYGGADRDNRGDHDLWFFGYNTSVEGSPMARLLALPRISSRKDLFFRNIFPLVGTFFPRNLPEIF